MSSEKELIEAKETAGYLTRMLSDSDGNPSSVRFLMIFTSVITMVVWAGANIVNGIQSFSAGDPISLVTIPAGVLTFIGVVTGVKVGQKKFEKK